MTHSFLRIKNGTVIDELENEVVLRGVNLGGWLIQESWMCPVSGEDREWANLNTLKTLEQRFTNAEVKELFKVYEDHWITKEDVEFISSLGCNAIRVPFWYRNFMEDANGTWIKEDHDVNPGFKRLDWIIDMARESGLYVILDLHGCPGGQSMDHCCGTLMENRLYTDEGCQKVMEELWQTIAKRYVDEPVVAAYDIMNEPQNNGGYEGEHSYSPWEPHSWQMSNAIHDRMIRAIREVDQRHIITVEGIWRLSNLPDPRSMGWDNMMYQIHLYDDDEGFAHWTDDIAKVSKEYGVAGYIGEFQNMRGLEMCNKHHLSWTTWTYKGTRTDIGEFFWFFGDVEIVDVKKDSFEEIKRKWGEAIETKHFNEKSEIIDFIKKYSNGSFA